MLATSCCVLCSGESCCLHFSCVCAVGAVVGIVVVFVVVAAAAACEAVIAGLQHGDSTHVDSWRLLHMRP